MMPEVAREVHHSHAAVSKLSLYVVSVGDCVTKAFGRIEH
jgi:hypothetical protein